MTQEAPYVAQVGGDHYEAGAPDWGHWDIIERNDVAYLEATASKYVVRYDRKGTPAQDLRKAISYLERMLKAGRGVRRKIPLAELQEFARQNQLDRDKQAVMLLLFAPDCGSMEDARSVIRMLDNLVRREEGR